MNTELFRREFARTLGSNAEYLKIKENSKSPVGSFLPGKKNRLSEIPLTGNYGVIPTGRLIILDIDDHGKGSSVDIQVAAFSKILGVQLEDTFHVDTPSEGRHFYLKIPQKYESLAIPKTTLRSAQDAINALLGYNIVVDADIRSAAANAYVVGPTSELNGKTYRPLTDNRILSITQEGFKNLIKLREESTKKDPRTAKAPASVDLWKTDRILIRRPDALDIFPPKRIVQKIEAAIASKNLKTYHAKRAFVAGALQCCYSAESIAEVCAELQLDYDSSTNRRIPRYLTLGDVQKLIIANPYHGAYCPLKKESAPKKDWTSKDLEELIRKQKAKNLARRAQTPPQYTKGEFRVVAMEKVYRQLMKTTNRKQPTTQIMNALFIVENLIQPLSNIGLKRYMLANSFITANSKLTTSQVAAALRVLREAKVIRIEEHQRTGATTVYRVPEHLYSEKLSGYLRSTWGNSRLIGELDDHKPAILWSSSALGFVYSYSGEVAHINNSTKMIAENHQQILSEIENLELKFTVSRTYLKFERQWLAENPEFELVLHSEEELAAAAELDGAFENSLVESNQLTGEEGRAPQNSSDLRPGLRARLRAALSTPGLAHLGALGRGGGSGPTGSLPPPSQALA